MIAFAMIGTNDLGLSSKFYDKVLNELNIIKSSTDERYIGYAKKNTPDKIIFYITKPFNKKLATNGNGTMLAFLAESKNHVDRFHKIALENGASNEGLPGNRPPDSNNYYAYIRDLNGNKICAHFRS